MATTRFGSKLVRLLSVGSLILTAASSVRAAGEDACLTDKSKKLLACGDVPPDAAIPPAELAAWTLVGNVLLNLDEFVSKR